MSRAGKKKKRKCLRRWRLGVLSKLIEVEFLCFCKWEKWQELNSGIEGFVNCFLWWFNESLLNFTQSECTGTRRVPSPCDRIPPRWDSVYLEPRSQMYFPQAGILHPSPTPVSPPGHNLPRKCNSWRRAWTGSHSTWKLLIIKTTGTAVRWELLVPVQFLCWCFHYL